MHPSIERARKLSQRVNETLERQEELDRQEVQILLELASQTKELFEYLDLPEVELGHERFRVLLDDHEVSTQAAPGYAPEKRQQFNVERRGLLLAEDGTIGLASTLRTEAFWVKDGEEPQPNLPTALEGRIKDWGFVTDRLLRHHKPMSPNLAPHKDDFWGWDLSEATDVLDEAIQRAAERFEELEASLEERAESLSDKAERFGIEVDGPQEDTPRRRGR